MDPLAAALATYLITVVGGIVGLTVIAGHQRQQAHSRQLSEENHGEILRDIHEAHAKHVEAVYAHLERMTTPAATHQGVAQPTQLDELYGQVEEDVKDFHQTHTPDPADTKDWTDWLMPDARGDEPRVATIRPGDSVVPGQGNWDQMMAEGRGIVGGEMTGGEEQWEE